MSADSLHVLHEQQHSPVVRISTDRMRFRLRSSAMTATVSPAISSTYMSPRNPKSGHQLMQDN